MKVVIIQRILPHYRVEFFRKLSARLSDKGIDLKIIYGQERKNTVPKSVDDESNYTIKIKNTYFGIGGKELVWQPCKKYLQDADLIILEQANRLLINYLLLWGSRYAKLAFWGHGRNMQSKSKISLSEYIKTRLANSVEWWFAYTRQSAEVVFNAGFPIDKITTVENSIDTDILLTAKCKISEEKLVNIKKNLGISSSNIGIYCGGLYEDKRLEFLAKACDQIKAKVKDFHLVIIGDGPKRSIIEKYSVDRNWVHYMGHLHGEERVPYFLISRISLMPGLVGLAIIDSFVMKTPLVTTEINYHSPEIDYLINGVNGVIAQNNVTCYAHEVSELLIDSDKYAVLVDGCRVSSNKYTLDNMLDNFIEGIEICLASGND